MPPPDLGPESGTGLSGSSEPAHSLPVLNLWKLFRFTDPVIIEILITRMAGPFSFPKTSVTFSRPFSPILATPPPRVRDCAFNFVSPPDPWLSCTTHINSLSDECFFQEGFRSVPQSSQKQSSVGTTVEDLSSVPPITVRSSFIHGELRVQSSIPACSFSLRWIFIQWSPFGDEYVDYQSRSGQCAREHSMFPHYPYPFEWYGDSCIFPLSPCPLNHYTSWCHPLLEDPSSFPYHSADS